MQFSKSVKHNPDDKSCLRESSHTTRTPKDAPENPRKHPERVDARPRILAPTPNAQMRVRESSLSTFPCSPEPFFAFPFAASRLRARHAFAVLLHSLSFATIRGFARDTPLLCFYIPHHTENTPSSMFPRHFTLQMPPKNTAGTGSLHE